MMKHIFNIVKVSSSTGSTRTSIVLEDVAGRQVTGELRPASPLHHGSGSPGRRVDGSDGGVTSAASGESDGAGRIQPLKRW